ncbi:MAG: 1-acyl-sn-glycerol-3-phosphate acyltransferase [Labilithrix sp.]|nr:1-acyl-sn-glycerol-3-phosphate acyltransferase [Labilithrix sp.]MCW5812751.1 1-acyl-sn-glycerol-3-phosphate acyltransferase [Labilithrix sp.]
MRPTAEQLAPLSRLERATFELADFFARPALTPISATWNSAFMGALIYSCGGRRFHVHGLEILQQYGKKDSVLLVANHRSFFDFFTITALCYWRTNLTKRIFFPVRQKFFYDHPAGPLVNAVMSGMRMFPPVMREKEKKGFNQYSVERCIEELNRTDIGTVLGIHPEGTRNKNDDPYTFLPAQPGVGRIALGATRAKVIPVFALGMGQSILGEMKMNALTPKEHPVDVYFGPPVDVSDLRARTNSITMQKRAADRCLDAVKALAEKQRRAAAIRDGRDPDAEPSVSERALSRRSPESMQPSADV